MAKRQRGHALREIRAPMPAPSAWACHPFERERCVPETRKWGNADSPPTDARSRSAAARRVLIIGLDGATFDILDPLMAEGRMPRLKAAVESGTSGVLRSTVPPITPAAWTTFLTGKQPGSHGIIDFERYDVHTNKLSFNSTRCLDHVRNLWRILGDHGLKVGSVNVPMTYPPVPVNGFLVSGFETPGPDSDFAYPRELKSEILERWPDPTLRAQWRRSSLGGDALFERNVAYISRSFHQGAEMTMFLGEKFGWDVLMVVLKLMDNLQHKTWKYLDPRWRTRNPVRCELAKRGFEEADKAIGTLLDYAARRDATVLMVSDHGHGSLEGKVYPNLILKRWGYLSLRGGGAQKLARGRYVWDRLRGRTRRFKRAGNVEHDLAVDFSKTRACVMHAGMAGFVYINLEGRQPTGIVKPGEYEALRDELAGRFLSDECQARDPGGSVVRLFAEVYKPEELYGCSREDQPWMPDLLLIPRESLAVVRKIRGRRAVHWLPYRRLEGTHRPDGILVATGPGIARGRGSGAHIVDCAPTILAMLGLPVPDDMEGRVITEIFETPPAVEMEQGRVSGTAWPRKRGPCHAPAAPSSDEVYSEEDLQRVTERLSDLGYLE
jgi:predicted AlkP superfamily phosphohydrolase/phosphomutase